MDYTEGNNAISYAESLQGGDDALSSIVFDESVVSCSEGVDFAGTYSTLKESIQNKLDEMVTNMSNCKSQMESIENLINGDFKVSIYYQRRYTAGGREHLTV